MCDDYSHSDMSLIYTTESILGPKENTRDYERLQEDYNSQYKGCDCKQDCLLSACYCLQQSHGVNYEKDIGETNFKLKIKPEQCGYPIYECKSNCMCSPTCGNRVVQQGPIECLKILPCENLQKGLGLFSMGKIPKDTFICEYAGELLTKSQALARINENELKNHMNYIFCLNEYSVTEITQTFVDPSKFGNIGRYINHSCDPNCVVIPVRHDSLVPKLAIFTCRVILPLEEITFHYGSGYQDKQSPKTIISPKTCLCNSERCQGSLPSDNILI